MSTVCTITQKAGKLEFVGMCLWTHVKVQLETAGLKNIFMLNFGNNFQIALSSARLSSNKDLSVLVCPAPEPTTLYQTVYLCSSDQTLFIFAHMTSDK